MTRLAILMTILTINSFTFAQDSSLLNKGDKAPYSGLLLSPEKAQDVKNKLIERDGLLQLNDSLNKSLSLQSDIINRDADKMNLCLTQNDNLAKNLNSERTMTDVEKIGLVLLGVGLTAVSAYVLRQINK